MHFSEIIKLQFRKNCHTLLYILALFRNIENDVFIEINVMVYIFFLYIFFLISK